MPVVDPPRAGAWESEAKHPNNAELVAGHRCRHGADVRAQELRFAWERWLHETATTGSSPRIPRSSAGRSPTPGGARAPPASTRSPTASRPWWPTRTRSQERWQEHPLGRTAPLIRECLGRDGRGGRLPRGGQRRQRRAAAASRATRHIRMRAAEGMNFAEGTLWSEPGTGTNAIGTALAVDHAVQVFGAEHFNEDVQRWTCSAAPIHDPDTGALLGVIDLTGRRLARSIPPASRWRPRRRGPWRPRCGSSCRSATRGCARATATRSRSAPDGARARDRHGPRRSPPCRAAWGADGRLAHPARRRAAAAALRARGGGRAGRARAPRPSWCGRVERPARGPARPCAGCAVLGRERAHAGDRRPPDRAAPPPRRDPRPALAATRTAWAPRRCAPTCTATAATRAACASRSRGCASCSARGSTRSATG